MPRIGPMLLCVLVLSGCASGSATTGSEPAQRQTRAVLRDSERPVQGVRYNRATGQCSSGAKQMLPQAEFEALTSDWRKPAGCSGVSKSQVPSSTGYPSLFSKLGKAGSAQVLVRLEADGSVESVHAVCASDLAFAEAAVETARTIQYSPANCDGKPVRSAFLLPFGYTP